MALWSGLPWGYWPSFLGSPLGWQPHASIRGDRSSSMKPTRLGQPICVQGCFPTARRHTRTAPRLCGYSLGSRAVGQDCGRHTPVGAPARSAVGAGRGRRRDPPTSIVVGLFVQSLNEVIDLHTKRVTAGVRNRIPGAIWAALFAVAVLSLAAMGYHAGLTGTTRSLAVLPLSPSHWSSGSCGSDRPQEGVLKVSQQALLDLRQSMQVPRP